MNVDAHHHLWDDPALVGWIDDTGCEELRRPYEMADLLPHLAREDITGTVLVECGNYRHDDLDGLLAAAEKHPEVLGVIGWIDTTTDPGDVTAQANRAYSHPSADRWLKGLRIQAQSAPADHLASESARHAATLMAGRDRVLEIVSKPHHLFGAARLAHWDPQCSIVLDHAGKPDIAHHSRESFAAWRRGIAALASAPNTYAKISGLVTEARWDRWTVQDLAPYVDTLIDSFGPHRLMLGSDWPACLLAGDYHRVTTAMHDCLSVLDADATHQVSGATAIDVYGLH